MSAQLNTVAGTIYEDFVVKMMRVKVSDSTANIIMKCTVVVTGIICLVLVLAIEQLKGIVQVSFKILFFFFFNLVDFSDHGKNQSSNYKTMLFVDIL